MSDSPLGKAACPVCGERIAIQPCTEYRTTCQNCSASIHVVVKAYLNLDRESLHEYVDGIEDALTHIHATRIIDAAIERVNNGEEP